MTDDDMTDDDIALRYIMSLKHHQVLHIRRMNMNTTRRVSDNSINGKTYKPYTFLVIEMYM